MQRVPRLSGAPRPTLVVAGHRPIVAFPSLVLPFPSPCSRLRFFLAVLSEFFRLPRPLLPFEAAPLVVDDDGDDDVQLIALLPFPLLLVVAVVFFVARFPRLLVSPLPSFLARCEVFLALRLLLLLCRVLLVSPFRVVERGQIFSDGRRELLAILVILFFVGVVAVVSVGEVSQMMRNSSSSSEAEFVPSLQMQENEEFEAKLLLSV